MSGDADDAVLVERGPVTTVTLNRPERRNALSREVTAGLNAALDVVEESDARCLVLRGAGGAFSAGGDIERMRERIEDDDDLDGRVRELERSTAGMLARLVELPIPTVAKIDGPAVGAGANLAIGKIGRASCRERVCQYV